ncbi:MAG: Gfo/Idh/MocA family oxidoreductase [Saprospiraceae bacterium]|nr:Gfo/Idh/MocA family oxidoreductase [Saprospiraceae bacterium]
MKIGVLGAGHLGKIHLKCIQQTEFELTGFYDADPKVRQTVSNELGIRAYEDMNKLIADSDCLDIVTPTTTHFELAMKAIEAGKHIFIEKPVTHTPDEAALLMQKAQDKGIKIQVGHVERYNPGFRALHEIFIHPGFIEGHRLSVFNPRGTDVSVVLDLMIHDLDIVLNLVKSPVRQVFANGVCVVSKTPDICNARIQFENGCVANLTASRISMKNMRKMRIFQQDAYISIDFLNKEAQAVRMEDVVGDDNNNGMTIHTNDGKKRIIVEAFPKTESNAIRDELQDFYQSVTEDKAVTVSIEDGYKALVLAWEIQRQIENQKL